MYWPIHTFIIITLYACFLYRWHHSEFFSEKRQGLLFRMCLEMESVTKLSDAWRCQEKSKWLRQNPVTAARHFQYHLNTFFQVFLKSSAYLVDYTIKIEYQARGSPRAHTILWIKDTPKSTLMKLCAASFTSMSNVAFLMLGQLVSKLVQKHKHSATCRRLSTAYVICTA